MAIPTTPTYSTFAQFQAFNRVASALLEPQWTPFALHAEWLIDTYIGFVAKFDPDQVMKFPTKDKNGASIIPDNVVKAHIELTSQLSLKGAQTASGSSSGGVKSQSWSGTGYKTESAVSADDINAQKDNLDLPANVRALLREYYTLTAQATY